ncbi:MAG: hypothetical protein HOQ05_09010 [Corynebacteriales bacterium]|nr:hypothetical protein [Mycobacteriales bacterium]
MNKLESPTQFERDLANFRADFPGPNQKFLLSTARKLNAKKGYKAIALPRLLRWGTATVTAGVVGAVAISLLPATSPDSTFGTRPASASVVLEQTAHNAARLPAIAKDGSVLYERATVRAVRAIGFSASGQARAEYLNGGAVTHTPADEIGKPFPELTIALISEETLVETWSPAGEQPTVKRTIVSREVLNPSAEFSKLNIDVSYAGPLENDELLAPLGSGDGGSIIGHADAPGSEKFFHASAGEEIALSTDPAQLKAEMLAFLAASERYGAPNKGSSEEMLRLIVQIFRTHEVSLSPQTREALLLIAADLPGLKAQEVEFDGRQGMAFGVTSSSKRDNNNPDDTVDVYTELVVDPDAGEVLGFRETTANGNVIKNMPKGQVFLSSSTHSEYVNAVGDTK